MTNSNGWHPIDEQPEWGCVLVWLWFGPDHDGTPFGRRGHSLPGVWGRWCGGDGEFRILHVDKPATIPTRAPSHWMLMQPPNVPPR